VCKSLLHGVICQMPALNAGLKFVENSWRDYHMIRAERSQQELETANTEK
jgi:hypothetical protein